MSLLAVVNPSRRRRRRKLRARRNPRHRKMTAKQLRYFGPRRARRRLRRNPGYASASPVGFAVNPRRRRRRSAGKRRYRRNPVGAPRFRVPYIMGAVQDAAIGAGGALAVDLAMAQAARMLPDTMTSKFTGTGTVNFGYYGAKLMIAIGLGMLGTQFLPGGQMRRWAATGTAGALTVSAYELTRAMLPPEMVLGYMSPGRIAGRRMGAYLRRGVGAYLPSPGAMQMPASEARVGEGAIQ